MSDALAELKRRRASGEMTRSQAEAFDELERRGVFGDKSVEKQQQEIVGRMSGELPDILSAQRPDSTGETLGGAVMTPENIRMGLEVGGMFAGGASAPFLGARAATTLAPHIPKVVSFLQSMGRSSPIFSKTATRMTGAGAGGAGGSLAAEPINPTERPFLRSGETALFGFAGEGVGGLLSKGGQMMTARPRMGGDIAQEVLQKHGGTLTMGEASIPGIPIQLSQGIASAGVTGRQVFKKLDEINEAAIQSAKNELLDFISKARPGDKRAGTIFINAINIGKKAHAEAASAKYKALDNEAHNILVDVSSVGQHFKELAKNITRRGGVGKTERGGALIDQLSKVKKKLTFSEAHELRSDLLATARDLKASGQESIALRNVNEAITRVEKAMESAASAKGGDFFKKYREVSSFYKRGKDAFTNDVTTKLLETNPERLGEYLFRSGNVSEVIQAKASLRQAKIHKPSLDTKQVFQQMKAGYLEAKLTGRGSTNVEAETVAKNLLKDLAETKFDRTMTTMFTPAEMSKVKDFATTAMRLAAKKGDSKELGVVVPVIQAMAFADMFTLKFNSPEMDLAILITPYVLARLVTNPKYVNKLIKSMSTPATTNEGAVLATELAMEIRRLNQEQKEAQ